MKYLFIITLTFCVNSLFAQSLIDIYKKGTIKLIPDTEYAQNNDWNKILPINPDDKFDDPKGDNKSLVMMPDGSVAVNHYSRNYFSVYDPTGKYKNDYYVTNSTGKKFISSVTIKGVNKNFFFNRPDAMGNMDCFDFEGKFIKTLTFKHSIKNMIPLSDNKFIIVGWTIWQTKFRDFVAIIDFDTDQETIIWDHFTEHSDRNAQRTLYDYSYAFERGGSVSFTSMPYINRTGLRFPPQIALVNNRIIIAIPGTGDILIYSTEGKLVSKEKITWDSKEISVDEQKEIQRNAIEKFKNSSGIFMSVASERINTEDAHKALLAQMEEDLSRITTPIHIPFFSSIIKDSDGNLLFFEIPEKTGANKFNVWVYNDGGKFMGQCGFECDEYDLLITPSKIVFHNGYIYSLQTLKNKTENPLRLVRFKLVGGND